MQLIRAAFVGLGAASACTSGSPASQDAAMDAGDDVTVSKLDGAAGSGPVLPPPPRFDGSFLELLEAGACTMLFGATCDGAEDCPGGGVCCGALEGLGLTFSSIECTTSCDGSAQLALCHSDDDCADGLACRANALLPFEFLGVCTPPFGEPFQTSGEPPGVIVCGAERCAAPEEQCCLGVVAETNPLAGVPREPYCAPAGEACECVELRVMSGGDGGSTDGGVEASDATPDVMAPDGG